MTLEQAQQEIVNLKHLLGQRAPKYNSEIYAVVICPKVSDNEISQILGLVLMGQSIKDAVRQLQITAADYEILLILSSSSKSMMAFGWYSELYN